MAETIEVIFKGTDKVSKIAKGIGGAVGGLGKTMAAGLAVGTAALGAAGVGTAALGSKLVMLGSDAAETSSLIEASLGDATESYTKRLKQFATQANRSFFELQQGSSTIIAMTKSMGASEKQAADFGVTFAEILANLGSFFNQADSDVLLDIQSALSGSSETMLKYGIDVKAGTLKQMALNQGLIETGEELTNLQRAQLVQQAIMEQGADAMGDAIRTSDGWANSLRGLKAQFTDAATEAGGKLIPAIQPLLKLANELASIIIPKLSDAFNTKLIPFITQATDGIVKFYGVIKDSGIEDAFRIYEDGSGALLNLATSFGISKDAAQGFLSNLFLIRQEVSERLAPVIDFARGILDKLKQSFDFVIASFRTGEDVINSIGTAIGGLILIWGGTTEQAINFKIAIENALTAVKNFIDPIIEWIKNNVELKDVLGALAIFIGVNLVTAIGSTVVAFAPFIAIGIALVGVVKLVRDNWDKIEPVLIRVKEATKSMIDAFKSGESPLETITQYVKDLALAFGVSEEQAEKIRTSLIKVWDQIIVVKDAILEFLEPIIEWIKNNVELQDVLIALAIVLGGVVLAAIVAIAQAIGPVILVVGGLIAAVVLVRKAWEKLQPTMKRVSDFFANKVSPKIKHFKDTILIPLNLAFEGLKITIDSVLKAVEKMSLGLIDINAPDWLKPGSPTPFENGLKGIRGELQSLYRQDLPALNTQMQGLQTTSTRTTTINQTQNIYTSRPDARRESRAGISFVVGGI